MLKVTPIPAFSDNYLWLIHAPEQPRLAVVVDPDDAAPVIAHLEQHRLELAANERAGHELAGPVEVFAEIRRWKDGFA